VNDIAQRTTKVAIVHDFLLYIGGAERNLLNFLHAFPEADLFFTFIIFNSETKNYLRQIKRTFPNVRIHTSNMQRWWFIRQWYRLYKFFTPWAMESLSLKEYDVIISQTSFLTKGFLRRPDQRVILYINTPFRWLWHLPTARLQLINWLPRIIREWWSWRLRQWDWFATRQATRVLGNSGAVVQRIKRYYDLKAHVLWPAIDYPKLVQRSKQSPADLATLTQKLSLPQDKPYIVMVDRLDLYKNHHRAITAFGEVSLHDYHLVIIGDGIEYANLERLMARSDPAMTVSQIDSMLVTQSQQITLIRHCSDRVRDKLRAGSLALLNLTEEDFGLGMAETLALGKPVIAYYRGGATDIVQHEKTGVLIRQRSAPAIAQALSLLQQLLMRKEITPASCVRSAEKFDRSHFITSLQQHAQHGLTPHT